MGRDGPYFISPCRSIIRCGLQNRSRTSPGPFCKRACVPLPKPASKRCRSRVERLSTPGATRFSSSRIRMICSTERSGTSLRSCTASLSSSWKLSGSARLRCFSRSDGRSPAKPSFPGLFVTVQGTDCCVVVFRDLFYGEQHVWHYQCWSPGAAHLLCTASGQRHPATGFCSFSL